MNAHGVARAVDRPSAIAAAGLVGGFAVARASGRRPLGGAVFAVAGGWCARRWAAGGGAGVAAALTGLYAGAMGVSHPLAKRVGAWPSVLLVAAVTAAASEAATRR